MLTVGLRDDLVEVKYQSGEHGAKKVHSYNAFVITAVPITGIRWNGGVGSIWRHPVPDDTWPTLTDWVWIKQTWWSRSSYSSRFYGQHLRSGESKRVSTMKARRVRKKYMFHRSSQCRTYHKRGWFSQQPLCSIYRTGNRSRLGSLPPWKDTRSWWRAGRKWWHQRMTTVGWGAYLPKRLIESQTHYFWEVLELWELSN